jgi:Ca-activated chloride channel family protein
MGMRRRFTALLLIGSGIFGLSGYGQSELKTIAETRTAEESLIYGLVIDNSGSLKPDLKQIVRSVRLIIDSNNQDDECFVVRFVATHEIETMQDFTRDKAALSRAAQQMYVSGGQSAVIDALYVSAEHLSKNRKSESSSSRRALILITDGDDRGSYYKVEQLLQLLREKKIPIFVLGLPHRVKKDRSEQAYKKAILLMNAVAQETGGRVFIAEKASDLEGSTRELLKSLRGK